MKKNEKGFGAIEGILVLVIICLVVFVGWYVWHNKATKSISSPTTNSQAATSSTPSNTYMTTKTDKTTLKVNELGIKIINIPPDLSDMNYAVNVNGAQPGSTSADFSTESLSKLDNGCSPTGHVSDNGMLTKNDGTYTSPDQLGNDSPDTFVMQLKGFWISYAHPQAACSENDTTEALHLSQMKAFQELVNNPKNIEAL